MHVLFLILVAVVIAGCSSGPAKAVQASTCREQGLTIVRTASSCAEAKAALERLLERSPECAAVLNDDAGAGVHCKGDGGT